jgi:hypothetical protein
MFPAQALSLSVQEQEPKGSLGTSGGWWAGIVPPRADILPPWGLRSRDIALRKLYLASHNTLVQGVISYLVHNTTACPWEIQGGRNLTYKFQELLQYAHFGDGWDGFLERVLTDYLTQDFGAVIEIIGRGNPDQPLRGEVVGISHLDSLRCAATGNWEYPIIYWPKRGGDMYRLHWTRVFRLVDMPSTDERAFGNGLCALSRAAGIATVQQMLGKYQVERLDNLPPSGIAAISGITDGQFTDAMAYYEAAQTKEGNVYWRNILRLIGVDPANPVKIEFTSFAQLPEQFDYEAYMRMHVNALALAFGVDPQDVWPLSGAALGTGAQSKVLHQKGQGKAPAEIRGKITRMVNLRVLPESLEFEFKYRDKEADQQEAERAQVWVTTVNAAPITPEQRQLMLAKNVEAFADVLLDDKGQLIEVPDVDRQPPDVPATMEDNATPGTQPDNTVNSQTPANTAPQQPPAKALRFKAIQSTRLDFEGSMEDLLASAVSNAIDRTTAGIQLRGLVAQYIPAAYSDGLADGGVQSGPSRDDQVVINGMIADQSAYISNMLDTLYVDGLTEAEVNGKPSMWFAGSIMPAYSAGLLSADANAMMEFGGEDGDESCKDCQRLKGQRHRFSDWYARNLVPSTVGQDTECGGWRCRHLLVRVDGAEVGNW